MLWLVSERDGWVSVLGEKVLQEQKHENICHFNSVFFFFENTKKKKKKNVSPTPPPLRFSSINRHPIIHWRVLQLFHAGRIGPGTEADADVDVAVDEFGEALPVDPEDPTGPAIPDGPFLIFSSGPALLRQINGGRPVRGT
jgi:hypothetical protein